MIRFLPLLLLFFSCCTTQHEKNISLEKIPTIAIEGELITSELMAYHTMQSAYIQSHLFYFTPTDEQVCLVVEPVHGTEIGTFGSFGNGPGELSLFPIYAGRSERGDTIYMFDESHKINVYALHIDNHKIRYNFVKSISVERNDPVEQVKSTFAGIQRLSNGYYVGLNLIHTHCLFSLYDRSLRHIKDFGDFPITDTPSSFFFLPPFEGPLRAHGNHIYYAAKRFGYMANYKISDNGEVSKVWEHHYSPPSYRISNGEIKFQGKSNLHGFSDVVAGKKYIFALYSGIPCGKMFEERSIYAIEPKTLVILKPNGSIVGKYTLKNPCNTLCLSEDEQYIYIKTSHPDISIERFCVKDLIKNKKGMEK